ncbi:MAG: hypothetical protein SCARUB_05081 [Candidatus Scalindua rubra]|uniref:Uncharacterized protein n=1 Tax=Candidatus Scalindua rubra TaxID=1872076 RepID=A0A1E3X2F6_9BACT|nr:MAG: hypothetical protein SCARUB_05081 [Candidatus Scalindua rubra]
MDFHKLKLDQFDNIKVLNLPSGVDLPFTSTKNKFQCLISFVQTEAEVDEAISQVVKVGGGTSLIIAYPKGASKKFQSEVNRDTIIAKIKAISNFKAPKLVSLNQDWSGFSFRYE